MISFYKRKSLSPSPAGFGLSRCLGLELLALSVSAMCAVGLAGRQLRAEELGADCFSVLPALLVLASTSHTKVQETSNNMEALCFQRTLQLKSDCLKLATTNGKSSHRY